MSAVTGKEDHSFVVECCGIKLDFANQGLLAADLANLIEFAKSRNIQPAFNSMRNGDIVNLSENRQALHTSLRDPSSNAPHALEVHQVLKRFLKFADAVRSGQWLGCTGKKIKTIVNIGIGGSDMGPRAVWHALKPNKSEIEVRFLAAADGVTFDRTFGDLTADTTLIVISSKSWKTQETHYNSQSALDWYKSSGIDGKELQKHVVVVSANPNAASSLGLPEENQFPIWDWVGGRFSFWSSIGLPVAIGLGSKVFLELLEGAHEMDEHTSKAPIERNLPALLALIAYRNITQLNVSSYCFLAYDERLRMIVDWLQQLEMESLGKNKSYRGEYLTTPTAIAVWGGHGNESQHSFYQWLREGTSKTAIDICWCIKPGHKHENLHRVLIANAQAQTKALVTREPEDKNFNVVSVLTINELNAKTLGSLMALYEHKTVMLACLFGLNPFDQPGVELGKKLAREILGF